MKANVSLTDATEPHSVERNFPSTEQRRRSVDAARVMAYPFFLLRININWMPMITTTATRHIKAVHP
ncbi:MAG: hypothetical protein ABSD29_25660 [Verrucomicrobiota bacterium]|jgi:hypothetical protein